MPTPPVRRGPSFPRYSSGQGHRPVPEFRPSWPKGGKRGIQEKRACVTSPAGYGQTPDPSGAPARLPRAVPAGRSRYRGFVSGSPHPGTEKPFTVEGPRREAVSRGIQPVRTALRWVATLRRPRTMGTRFRGLSILRLSGAPVKLEPPRHPPFLWAGLRSGTARHPTTTIAALTRRTRHRTPAGLPGAGHGRRCEPGRHPGSGMAVGNLPRDGLAGSGHSGPIPAGRSASLHVPGGPGQPVTAPPGFPGFSPGSHITFPCASVRAVVRVEA